MLGWEWVGWLKFGWELSWVSGWELSWVGGRSGGKVEMLVAAIERCLDRELVSDRMGC